MSASHVSCRHRAEGSLTYDLAIEDRRCRAWDATDQ